MLLFGEPVIAGVVPLPSDGGSVSAAIDRLEVQLSEDLNSTGANQASSWRLIGAGTDGALDTADDVSYSLSVNPPYSSGTVVFLDIGDRLHPLQEDQYRFTALASGLSDLEGNSLDGDGDGTGGDDFVTRFTVDAQPGSVIETIDNNVLDRAVPLDMMEDPTGSGYSVSFGLGTMQPTSDVDYWWFEALDGDRVSIAVDSPDSDINPRISLRNSDDVQLSTDDNNGPGTDAYISSFTITSSGRYFARVSEQSSSATGSYELRVDVTRGALQLESDANYANDTISGADPLTKMPGAPGAIATVAGTIMATGTSSDAGNTDEDVFDLGELNAGNQVNLDLRLPGVSQLDGRVKLLDAAGNDVADDDGNLNDADYQKTIVLPGRYYAQVEANSGAGTLGQYLLDVSILDSVSPRAVGVTGLPGEGQSVPLLEGDFTVQFDEDLDPASFGSGAFELQAAGTDQLFGTGDDVVYELTNVPVYERGSSITFHVSQGEIISGDYRLTVSGVTDVAGNSLDGNGDGTGADPFTRDFTVALPGGLGARFQDAVDDSRSDATLLSLLEDPTLAGSLHGVGIGSLESTGDEDFWSFDAQSGDRVLVYTATAHSGLDTQTFLQSSAGSNLTNDFRGGADNDDLVSHFTIPSDGTYFLRVRRLSLSLGDYEVYVHVARGTQMETDSEYNNDSLVGADVLTFSQNGNQQQASVAGLIVGPQGTNEDEDTFVLGPLNVDNVLELDVTLPGSSTLAPLVRVFDSAGSEVSDEDGDSQDGHFLATIQADDTYYAQVAHRAWVSGGHRYVIVGSMTWPNAQVFAQSLGGYLVSINDAPEEQFLSQTFVTLGDQWIGLSDAVVEGDWSTWTDGTPVTFNKWAPGEPNGAGSFDYAYRESTDGQWYDRFNSNTLPGIVEIPDNGGLADGRTAGPLATYVLDVDITDPIPPRITNVTRLPAGGSVAERVSTFEVDFSERLDASSVDSGFDLREAGNDGTLGTADDIVYSVVPSYDGNTRVDVTVQDGPLATGSYEFRVTSSVTDAVGNPLDGNGDGSGGDDFVRTFTVAPPPEGFLGSVSDL